MIQVAIAVGSMVGGTVVDRVGIPADFWFGSALALLGLAALASFGAIGERSANAELMAQVRVE
jgi:predicted MFS family arabinose efflux permease